MHRKAALLVSLVFNVFLVSARALTFPAPSLWTINPTASTSSDNGPLPSDKTIHIEAFSTAGIALTERFTDQTGTVQEIGWSGTPGTVKPVTGLPGVSGFFKDDGSYRFVLSDGTVEQGIFTLSEKEHVLNDTYTVTPKGGPPIHVKDVYKRAH
jgi:hypothetical protein